MSSVEPTGKGSVWSSLVPSRAAAVDLAAIVVLGLVAFVGFRETFAGTTYLAAGGLGLVLGITVAHVAYALRQPFIVTAVLTIVAFFLLGGAVALHGEGAAAALPLPDTLISLADQGVHGWKELLTTLPPIDGGPLLTLPYLLGLVAGAGGGSLAVRLTSPWIPVLAPIGLLSAVILLGVQEPGDVVVLGAAFAALAVGWLVVRARRLGRTTVFTRRRVRQRLTAAGLVLAAGAGAFALGPDLPGADDERFVLRTKVDPPFDVGQYPSLLASFRNFRPNPARKTVADEPLLTVEGLEPGSLIRFTTLNAYDGTVWGAANLPAARPGDDDTYQKVGSTIANAMGGTELPKPVTVTIEKGYKGVWLPTFGGLRSIDFVSDRLEEEADHFRYNLASAAGVMPGGLRPGDRYTFEAVVPRAEKLGSKTPVAAAPLVTSAEAAQFQADAVRLSGGAATPMAQVLAIADRLRDEGSYTDGDGQYAEYRAGHSIKRIKEFLDPDADPAGNDEQYAATMALMANQLGVPARVVVGAPVPSTGTIKGSDVRAWVELRGVDGSWLTLPTERFMSKEKPPQAHSRQVPDLKPGETVPPPVPVRPPSTAGDSASDSITRRGQAEDDGFRIPGILITVVVFVGVPLLVVSAVICGIVVLKRERRKRRRTRGVPSRRLAWAYRDLLDQARDLGLRVHSGRTRREQAADLGIDGFVVMARAADAHVFGPGEPTDEDVEAYWADADRLRADLTADLSRWGRLRAAVNLTSFTPLRRRGAEA